MSQLFVLDRSPRGVLQLTGPDRAAFLQGMVSNDVAALQPGSSCHAALLDATGHILADLFVHARLDTLLLETDSETLSIVHTTLDKFLIMEDVQIADASRQWAVVSVLGAEMFDLPAALLPHAYPTSFPILPGIDLWLPPAEKDAAWRSLLAAGFSPMTAEEAEALRIEVGIPKWGAELSPSVLLPEAEMLDAVSYTKGCYVGQEIVARLHARGHTNRAPAPDTAGRRCTRAAGRRDRPCSRRRPGAGPGDRQRHQRRRVAVAGRAGSRAGLCPQRILCARNRRGRTDFPAERPDVFVCGGSVMRSSAKPSAASAEPARSALSPRSL